MKSLKTTLSLALILGATLGALQAASAFPVKWPPNRCVYYVNCCPPGHLGCLQ